MISGRGIVNTVLRSGGKKWDYNMWGKGLCSSESEHDIMTKSNILKNSYQHFPLPHYRQTHMTWCQVDKLWG